MLDRPRSSRIFYGGKFFAYPLKAVEALMKLGLFKSTRCVLSYEGARFSGGEPEELRRLGDQPVRQTPLQYFLQELHRKGLGHALQGDLGRLGGAAHQGPLARKRDQERALAQKQPKDPARSSRR